MKEYEILIERLERLAAQSESTRMTKAASRAASLVRSLDKRGHDPQDVQEFLQIYRDVLELTPETKTLGRATSSLLSYLEKEHDLVPPAHYQNQWMSLGLAAFGLPIGVVMGTIMDNMAFIGIGLPLGLAIGLSIGSGKDKEAAREGRQLEMPEA